LSEDAGGVTETEPEAEPDDGAVEDEPDGGVVEPADEDDEEPGALAPVLLASLSQAVSRLAPSARDTAVARMESLMKPPWLGYHRLQQHSGQQGSDALNDFLPTTVVGSYPQPHWLIDRAKLGAKVPRVRAPDIWRIAPPDLEAAQNDATLLAIGDMERA
jgi:hypothetical protein